MNVHAYLQRIMQEEVKELNFATLSQLQMNHLLHVPFENLDVMHNVDIPLDVKTYYQKIVENKRGGFCYELNGLFCWLLESLGYKSKLISAAVKKADGTWTMEGSHAALIVDLEQPYFVDVGFGDSARAPLPLTAEINRDVSGAYRIWPVKQDMYELQRLGADNKWMTRLRFTTAPKKLADFKEPCHFNQTSPDSHFTQRELVTIATKEGRVTFSNDRLIVTYKGEKKETPIPSEEKAAVFNKYFGISLKVIGADKKD